MCDIVLCCENMVKTTSWHCVCSDPKERKELGAQAAHKCVTMQILQLDVHGRPQSWLSQEAATVYYATDAVCWTVGDVCATMRGGVSSITGRQSTIDLHPIIAVTGAAKINLFDFVPSLTNAKLFRRERGLCSYCARDFGPTGHGLTRDHIVPTSRGGADTWSNVTSACSPCNHRKANLTPEEAGMPLLMLPYVPSIMEDFILRGRNIRSDVHEWLASRVSKNSRWANN